MDKGTTCDVTVVTAVFNAVDAGRHLSFLRCLASVQEQKGVSLEHVIVDGGSTDGTIDLVSQTKGHHPQIVISEPDKGIYDAMNKGVRRARGKYIAFLNSDDYYHECMGLRWACSELERTGADFSYAPVVVINELGRFSASNPQVGPDPDKIFTQMELSHQSMLTRRTVFDRIGLFNLDYRSSSDYDFLLRMIFSGCRACHVPRPFVTFAMGGYSTANVDMANHEVAKIYSRLYSRQTGIAFSEETALRSYLDKALPPELEEALLTFGKVTFGWTAQQVAEDALAGVPGRLRTRLLDFRRQIMPARATYGKRHRHMAVMRCIVLHPILCWMYFLLRREMRSQVHELRVKPVAYDELVYRILNRRTPKRKGKLVR